MFALVALIIAQGAPPAAEAEAASDEELFALDSVLVATASRVDEPLRFAPASITVVPRAEVEAFGFAYTGDALLGVRGLSVTNDELWPSLGVRGFNRFADYGNRVQVQIDGHVMNDDWIYSSYVSDDQLTDLAMIDSIEVLRGPGSALYGTGALFGVINLRTPTRAPTYRVRGSVGLVETLTARLHVDGGAPLALSLPMLGIAPEQGGAWASVSAQGHAPLDYHSDAYVGTPGAEDGTARGADKMQSFTAMAKAFAGDFTLQGNWHRRDRTYPTGAYDTAFGDPRNVVTEDRGFLELRYEPTLAQGQVRMSTRAFVDYYGYNGVYTSSSDPDAALADDYASPWGGAEVRATAEVLKNLRVIGGAIYELHPFVAWQQLGFVDEHYVFHSGGVYLTADWRPFSWLLVGAGARGDGWLYHSPSRTPDGPLAPLFSLNPRVHAIWSPDDDDTVKLLVGRAYRAPSVYELEYTPTGFDLSSGATPVAPEAVTTVELEYTRGLPLDVDVIGAVYGSAIEGLIGDSVGDSFADGYANQALPVYAAGAELELRKTLDASSGIAGSAYYAYQRVRIGSLVDGIREQNSPEHLAGVKLLVPLAGERLGVGQRLIVDAGRLDREGALVSTAAIWDVTLSGKAPEVSSLTWSVGVRNVLDARYEHPVDNAVRDTRLPQPGRNIRVELSLAF